MTTMPKVSDCAVSACSYNHDGCTAFAMNMGSNGCTTFVQLGKRGGLDRVIAQVGACQRAECAHNDHLECTASAVRVGDTEECLTFQMS